MKIVICFDSFKDSISAVDAGQELQEALQKRWPQAQIVNFPLADGGEGSLQCLQHNVGAKLDTEMVKGPLGKPHEVQFAKLDQTAVVELANVSGLQLVPPAKRNPGQTSTYGLGQLIVKLGNQGFKQIVVALGGSSSCDGGTGMAAALGYKFWDAQGRELEPVGDNLVKIARITESQLPHIAAVAACDVSNPLLGPTGAAAVYAPQKGATPQQVEHLEAGLANLAKLIKQKWGRDVTNIAGAGAAGGLAAGLVAFLNASIVSGAEYFMQKCHFEQEIANADLLITGEGSLDNQINWGKLVGKVLEKAGDIPVIAIVGRYPDKSNLEERFQQIISLEKLSGNKHDSLQNPRKYLQITAGLVEY
jgi:glycerate kinase